MLALQGAWFQSQAGGLKDRSRCMVWLKKIKGSMKGSMKYRGHLPQLPSAALVPAKISRPSSHPPCACIISHGGVVMTPKAAFSFWMVPMDGPVAFTLWSPPCPPPVWKVLSLSEPAWGHRGRISRLCAESISHVRLFATLWTVARQAPLVHGISLARILEWVVPFPKGSSQPRDQTRVSQASCLGRRVLYH